MIVGLSPPLKDKNLVLRSNMERITFIRMSTISLKLPDKLLALLEKESRSRRTTKSSLVREALEKALAARPANGGGDLL